MACKKYSGSDRKREEHGKMARTVAIGYQNYQELIERNAFYIDKTLFIKEWWENIDKVITVQPSASCYRHQAMHNHFVVA